MNPNGRQKTKPIKFAFNTTENFVFFLPRINQLHIINAVNMGNYEEFLCGTISFYKRNSSLENFLFCIIFTPSSLFGHPLSLCVEKSRREREGNW